MIDCTTYLNSDEWLSKSDNLLSSSSITSITGAGTVSSLKICFSCVSQKVMFNKTFGNLNRKYIPSISP